MIGRSAPAAIVPHWGLAAGHLAHGLSWVALGALAARGQIGITLPGFAWVHLVTLGWLTLVSLAVLVHVLEELFDVRWPGGLAVRWTLAPYTAGVVGLVGAFWLSDPRAIAVSAVVVVGSIAAWLAFAVGAFSTFVPAPDRSIRALRAFQLVLVMLAATATLGVGMAWTLGYGGAAWWLARAPALHAHLGGLGWLTLLVVGVAQRTMGALFGRRSERIVFHVVALSCFLFAVIPLAIGLAGGPSWLNAVALGLGGLGVVSHAVDIGLIARGATSAHRPPQAFVLAATAWLAVAVALGAGVLAGRGWQPAYAFAALVGWIGQMVNGHLHHIPVVALGRLVGLKEVSPGDWLRAPLSWAAFALFQVAVAVVTVGGVAETAQIVLVGAICGGLAWVVMTANLASAALALRATRPSP